MAKRGPPKLGPYGPTVQYTGRAAASRKSLEPKVCDCAVECRPGGVPTPLSQLIVARVVLRAGHVETVALDLVPLEVGHVHQVLHRYAVLLRRPDLEDGVLVGELDQVEPLHRHAVVVHDELARAALEGLRVLLLVDMMKSMR